MSAKTDVAAVTNQVQKFWAPLFMKELRASLLLGGLVNKDYQGEIKKGGDTVRVSQINAPTGENRSVGTDADAFSTDQLSTSYVDIQANKRAVASFEFDDLSQIQSQIGNEDSEIRAALQYAVSSQINKYLYSLVAPASANKVVSKANLTATELLLLRKLAASNKWMREKGWWLLADPQYMNDLLAAQTMTSRDYVDTDTPVVGGQMATKRFGFNILEDNALGAGQALAFHPDFMHLVMQQDVQFKISDLHSQKKFGFVISADIIYGAAQGVAGDKKHAVCVTGGSFSSIVLA